MTAFTDVGIRSFDVSENGGMIVFERGTGVFTQPAAGGSAMKLDVQLSLDDKFYDSEMKTFSRDATEYALSPNEKFMALCE